MFLWILGKFQKQKLLLWKISKTRAYLLKLKVNKPEMPTCSENNFKTFRHNYLTTFALASAKIPEVS